MKIVKTKADLIDIATPGKKMEFAGRVCYLSRDKITEDSYIKFLNTIISSGHTSILEHERVILKIDLTKRFNPFLTISQEDHMKFFNISNDNEGKLYISSNIRGWYNSIHNDEIKYDNGIYSLLKSVYPFIFTKTLEEKDKACCEIVKVKDLPEDIRKFHDSKTFDIICSRACSHQLVRHRSLSFSQQSQRYVNFSKDKYGHSIDFIMPNFIDRKNIENKDVVENKLLESFKQAEENYFYLTENGLLAEDARCVLPNATATEIVVTGTTDEWEKFINLRSDSHAQEEIRQISNTIKSYLK